MRVQLVMKYVFVILLLAGCGKLSAQAAHNRNDNQASSPSQIKVLTENKTMQQASYWQAATTIRKQDATAWLNYYIWTARDKNLTEKTRKLALTNIAEEAKTNVSNSSQYQLIKYLESGKKDSAALNKSLRFSTKKSVVYPYAIQYAIMQKDLPSVKKYCEALNAETPLNAALQEYHYNVLMSADSNASIYAKGYNDLVPLAILQQVFNVRKDIRLVVFTANETVPNGAYVCLSSGKEIIEKYNDACYTGLLVKTSCTNKNKTLLSNLQRFDFTSINALQELDEETLALYKNYLPPLIIAYKSYANKQSAEAVKTLGLLQKLGEATGTKETINKTIQ